LYVCKINRHDVWCIIDFRQKAQKKARDWRAVAMVACLFADLATVLE